MQLAVPPAAAQRQKPTVRAITAFVKLDRVRYEAQIAQTVIMLRHGKAAIERAGYEGQSIRIVPQPSHEIYRPMLDSDVSIQPVTWRPRAFFAPDRPKAGLLVIPSSIETSVPDVAVRRIAHGPAFLASCHDESAAAPRILDAVVQANDNGLAAVGLAALL